jgi:hypothetical protein
MKKIIMYLKIINTMKIIIIIIIMIKETIMIILIIIITIIITIIVIIPIIIEVLIDIIIEIIIIIIIIIMAITHIPLIITEEQKEEEIMIAHNMKRSKYRTMRLNQKKSQKNKK